MGDIKIENEGPRVSMFKKCEAPEERHGLKVSATHNRLLQLRGSSIRGFANSVDPQQQARISPAPTQLKLKSLILLN